MSNFRPLVPSKRKSDEIDDSAPNKKPNAGRNPLGVLVADNVAYKPGQNKPSGKEETYWNVQWRKPQHKKHKTWDGDGVLIVSGSKLTLKDTDDKIISTGTISSRTGNIELGSEFSVGGKELEIDSAISKDDYLSGRCFGSGAMVFVPEKPPVPKFQPAKLVTKPAGSSAAADKSFNSASVNKPIASRKPSFIPERAPDPKPLDHPTTADYKLLRYYTVNWRKPQTKKFKTWDGDAYLVVTGDRCIMQDAGGRQLGTVTWNQTWLEGSLIHIGGKEVEIDNLITEKEFYQQCSGQPLPEPEILVPRPTPAKFQVAVPRAGSGYPTPDPVPKAGEPRHDPTAPGAIVMPRPSPSLQIKAGKEGKKILDVVIDPLLSERLRPHQKEGVIFLYETVMGMRRHEGQGAILADEMGLGKTLQTITLLWTMLRQSPYYPPDNGLKGVIGKAMIVCPVSLVLNWRNEIWKWLGRDRMSVFVADETKTIRQFNNSRRHDVLIIGYEKLRNVIQTLASCEPKIELIICDEGHRLKSANNKTSKMFDALKTKRRIILSGTPIQNDLSEFWSMADFCNPGLLADYNTFKRIYEQPILRSRMPNCTEKNKELGTARSEQLSGISKSYVLRRTADILSSYLPPKYEYVVFIRPTKMQLALMASLTSRENLISRIIRSGVAQSLELLNVLGKICTSPILLKTTGKPESQRSPEMKEMISLLPGFMEESDVTTSGKLIALTELLNTLRKTTEEKAIVVSQHTKTLDVVQAVCLKMRWSYGRLDGETPQNKRMELVNEFNRSDQASSFLFLLSLKAGGVGLNLVAASRLILLDSSWNPANDLQAMARIHRDGQKRPVHIYRFLTAGTIDEKVYMRQIIKTGLSDALMANKGDGKSKEDSFSPDELRDLFRVHPQTPSHTHDLLDCACAAGSLDEYNEDDEGTAAEGTDGVLDDSDEQEESSVPHRGWRLASQINDAEFSDKVPRKKKAQLAMLDEWTHINCTTTQGREDIKDSLLRDVVRKAYRKKTISKSDKNKKTEESRAERLLAQIDIEKVQDANDEDEDETAAALAIMDEVEGGAVTFLFTKSSM